MTLSIDQVSLENRIDALFAAQQGYAVGVMLWGDAAGSGLAQQGPRPRAQQRSGRQLSVYRQAHYGFKASQLLRPQRRADGKISHFLLDTSRIKNLRFDRL